MPTPEWNDDDLLTAAELAKHLGYESEKSIERMVEERTCPRPTKYGRKRYWRFGIIRKWKEAVEFMQQHGVVLPSENDGQNETDTDTNGNSGTSTDNARNEDCDRPKKR